MPPSGETMTRVQRRRRAMFLPQLGNDVPDRIGLHPPEAMLRLIVELRTHDQSAIAATYHNIAQYPPNERVTRC